MRPLVLQLTVFCTSLLLASGCLDRARPAPEGPEPAPPATHGAGALHPELAEDVKAEFLVAYQTYLRLADQHDELRPVSGRGSDFFAKGHPVALTVIESLDTLYVMGLDDELAQAVEIAAGVSFDIDADFQVFETVIRVVGGLLSGYHATEDPRLLAQAKDLTDRLMPAFERSPTGMPYRHVNLRTGAVNNATNVLAEIGTCIVEFGDLSRLTGDPRYYEAAKKAFKAVYDRRSPQDLVGTLINVATGQWAGTAEFAWLTTRAPFLGEVMAPGPVVSTINPPVDSFFEYLYEGHLFLGDPDLLQWYNTLTGAMLRLQVVELESVGRSGTPRRNTWISSVEYATAAPQSVIQSELASFYPGLLAQSGHLPLARAYHDSWKSVLDEGGYRILPEGLAPVQYQAVFPGNQLRPEYVDAAFLLWQVTNETKYVDRAVEYYRNMKATSRVPNGYTILTDVKPGQEVKGDLTPAYWFSENMKYYYLMFGRPDRFDYADNYLTTEGNILKGLRR